MWECGALKFPPNAPASTKKRRWFKFLKLKNVLPCLKKSISLDPTKNKNNGSTAKETWEIQQTVNISRNNRKRYKLSFQINLNKNVVQLFFKWIAHKIRNTKNKGLFFWLKDHWTSWLYVSLDLVLLPLSLNLSFLHNML